MEGSEKDSKPAKNTAVYKSNENVVEKNTESSLSVVEQDSQVNTNVVTPKTNVDKPKQTTKGNTERFTTKPWQVDGELPCPLCEQWFSASNFSRHAKQHGTNAHAIFTNEKHQKKIDEMTLKKTTILK